jgi:transcription-repair coupling factor (superfamily II helicase)
LLNRLAELFHNSQQFQSLSTSLREAASSTHISILESAKPLLMGAIWKELCTPILIVTPRPDDARRLYDRLLAYWGEDAPIYNFPEMESLPFERLTPDIATTHERLQALAALADHKSNQHPPFVVTSSAAISLKTLSLSLFGIKDSYHILNVGDHVSIPEILTQWTTMGYVLDRITDVPGSMSRRGGILDVFPCGDDHPVRVEFSGDIVESLRTFDPVTQLSIEIVNKIKVIPARELLPDIADLHQANNLISKLNYTGCSLAVHSRMSDDISRLLAGHDVEDSWLYSGFFNNTSILDFISKDGLVILDEPSLVEETCRELDRRSAELRDLKHARGDLPDGFPSPYFSWNEINQKLTPVRKRMDISRWNSGVHLFEFAQAPSFLGKIDRFIEEARVRIRAKERIVIISNHAHRLQELMTEEGMLPRLIDQLEEFPPAGSVSILRGYVSEGWIASMGQKVSLFTDSEIFGTTKIQRPRRQRAQSKKIFLSEITEDSYVVHNDHGIARFAGTTTLGETGEEHEYLILEYGEGDKLYVPTAHTDRISPYMAPGDKKPRLTRLGTQEWSLNKERVKRSTWEMAREILDLHARREISPGISIDIDSPWQAELEDSFPYVETPDQLEAILNIKEEMERPTPMDRLVCGDVGYGKTEVALRAAFKTVTSGMQVAILVPTTVLAQQHYNTFSERLAPYPVNVEVLSRFRTPREQHKVIDGIATGEVDICIGTHRLLQKDVRFKNLGLVVVDEEHRFGVAHKEHIKRIRANVDVLTLTATPIPRTLHMALSGIRDMSIMETPPGERLPIKMYISEISEDIVRDALLRELDRGGQVYFLHNRISSIASVAAWISGLVPEASVGIGHGRMDENKLEKTMAEFSRGEFSILVCTTIIESGLDLPNVNTLIVNRADTFGLAQLYQLRGRIGRGRHRAHAYFLVPKAKIITETAKKRLETMLAATEMGAGLRIAMKDLEIRGAGRLLGDEQSGHIRAVGFDLYSNLLAQAVDEMKSGLKSPISPETQPTDITLKLSLPGRIPTDYVEDLPSRLMLYQRLSQAQSQDDLHIIKGEIRDRFGPLPREAHDLIYTVKVRLKAKTANVELVTKESQQIKIRFAEEIGGAKSALQRELGQHIEVGHRVVRLDLRNLHQPWRQALLQLLDEIIEFRNNLIAKPSSFR